MGIPSPQLPAQPVHTAQSLAQAIWGGCSAGLGLDMGSSVPREAPEGEAEAAG